MIPTTNSPITALRQHSDSRTSSPNQNDPTATIIHELLCHRQGGETEAFAKRAIESLVKKLKDRSNDLNELKFAVSTKGKQARTNCVTIQRTLDGRLQVAGRKGFPHVIYAKLWRWPDLHKNEIKSLPICRFSFDMKLDQVCINPYHYERVQARETDLHGIMLNGAGTLPANFNTSQAHNLINNLRSKMNNLDGQNLIGQQSPSNTSPPGTLTDSQQMLYNQQLVGGMNPGLLDNTMGLTGHNLGYGTHFNQTNLGLGPTPEFPILPNYNVEEEIPQFIPLENPPDHWAKISYYEMDVICGESFKVSNKLKTIKVDGYLDPSSPNRFCLGQLTNVHRTIQSEKARIHIGRGLQLVKDDNGDVWIRTLSEHPIFVQSFHLDLLARRQLGGAVHKIYPNCYIKVFDLKQCHHEMWKRFLITKKDQEYQALQVRAGHGLGRTSIIPSICGVDDLRKYCVLRMSFVKGWGPDYARSTIKQCPCWIEILLNQAMKHLDQVLLQSGIDSSFNNAPLMVPNRLPNLRSLPNSIGLPPLSKPSMDQVPDNIPLPKLVSPENQINRFPNRTNNQLVLDQFNNQDLNNVGNLNQEVGNLEGENEGHNVRQL